MRLGFQNVLTFLNFYSTNLQQLSSPPKPVSHKPSLAFLRKIMAEITEASSSFAAVGSAVVSTDDQVLSIPKTLHAHWVLKLNPQVSVQGQKN